MHLRRIVIDTHKFVATPYDYIDVARYDVSNQVLLCGVVSIYVYLNVVSNGFNTNPKGLIRYEI